MTAIIGSVLFVILVYESLASNFLEEVLAPNFKIQQLTAGVIIALFVGLALFWMIIAIRNRHRRDR